MAKNQQKRLGLMNLSKDHESFDAMKGMENFTPLNGTYNLGNVQRLHDTMVELKEKETQAEATFRSLRDNTVAAEWAFHNAILDCKDQVKAQFGKDSNEVQAIGLKKSVDYKRPKRKKAAEMKVAA